MKFKDFLIKESKDRHAVLAFGRLQPPTTGHEVLVNKVKDVAKQHNAEHHIVLSHSNDPKSNPLSAKQKVKHAKRFFPGMNIRTSDKEAPNFLTQAAKLHKSGVTHFHMVAGSDRIPEYKRILKKYNGTHEGALFNFKKIDVHSAGERDPDAEGTTGMSGSKMRAHAGSGKYKEFKKGVPKHISDEHAKELYRDLRKGMNMKEDINEIFTDVLNEGVHDQGIFKAVFLAGGPGSGKDYVLSNTLEGQGLVEINSDKALEFLMDKKGLDKTMPATEKDKRDIVRTRAKTITELKQRLALLGRNGLIINGTGDDFEKISRIKEKLEELGYESAMILVNTDDEISKERNIERGQRGGRTVPEQVRKEKWENVQNSRPEFAKLFGQNYMEFDNSQDLRQAPPEVVKAKKEELLQLYTNIQEFVSRPPANEASQEWVATQMHAVDTLPIAKDGAEKTPQAGSKAAQEAQRLGLQYYGFGRYGQNGEVTYRSVHDTLVKVVKQPTEKPMNKNVNEEFEDFLNEAVTVTISGDTAEEVNKVIKKMKGEEEVEEETKPQYSLSDPYALNSLTLGKNLVKEELMQEAKYLTGKSGKKKVYMLRSQAASEAHKKQGVVHKEKEGYVIKLKESIDKGIEPGLSMAASGESPDRDMGEKIRKKTGKASQVAETIGAGGEMATSMSDQKEDELRRKGISLSSFKAKRVIG
jgi:nicotinamide mononucleotide adenylyltransferase/predicted ABC-type ATPase